MQDLKKFLPQNERLVYVDEINEYRCNEYIKGKKIVNRNEDNILKFGNKTILPGSTIYEILSQFAGLLIVKKDEKHEDVRANVYVYKIEELKFFRMCTPDEVLTIECKFIERVGKLYRIACYMTVDGKKSCKGDINLYTH